MSGETGCLSAPSTHFRGATAETRPTFWPLSISSHFFSSHPPFLSLTSTIWPPNFSLCRAASCVNSHISLNASVLGSADSSGSFDSACCRKRGSDAWLVSSVLRCSRGPNGWAFLQLLARQSSFTTGLSRFRTRYNSSSYGEKLHSWYANNVILFIHTLGAICMEITTKCSQNTVHLGKFESYVHRVCVHWVGSIESLCFARCSAVSPLSSFMLAIPLKL